VLHHDIQSNGSINYMNLAKEILQNNGLAQTQNVESLTN